MKERDHLQYLVIDGDNIKRGLNEMGCYGQGWMDLVQGRDVWRAVVYTAMNFRVLCNAGNCLTSWGTVNFSRRTQQQGVGDAT